MGKIIIIFVLALLLVPIAIILIRFNRKRVHIIRQAASATDDQLERVYRSIESKNTESPTCGVLSLSVRRLQCVTFLTIRQAGPLAPANDFGGANRPMEMQQRSKKTRISWFCQRSRSGCCSRERSSKLFRFLARLLPIPCRNIERVDPACIPVLN